MEGHQLTSLVSLPINSGKRILYFSRLDGMIPVHGLWRHKYEQASHRYVIIASHPRETPRCGLCNQKYLQVPHLALRR